MFGNNFLLRHTGCQRVFHPFHCTLLLFLVAVLSFVDSLSTLSPLVLLVFQPRLSLVKMAKVPRERVSSKTVSSESSFVYREPIALEGKVLSL